MSDRNCLQRILPGSWLGVLGGGQLGRMFTHAAQRLGYHVAVYDPQVDCPAAQSADKHFLPPNDEHLTLAVARRLADQCEVVTLEFENISAEVVRAITETKPACPGGEFLELCQDRQREKSSLSAAGFPTTPFVAVSTPEEILQAADRLGWPLVLKTCRSGYDGKGQRLVRDESEVSVACQQLGDTPMVAEQWIEFEAEVSMLAARNSSGETVCYPLLENDHSNHILDTTRCPVRPELQQHASQAREICLGIAERFDVVGLFCVEFFCAKDGRLLINEIAPRPHNSGHLTIEAFNCSQFEQQVRAVCNLPLIEPEQLAPAAMVNLLGDLWQPTAPRWEEVLQSPIAHLHLYGKQQPRIGRKMGHLTVVSTEDASAVARRLRERLRSPAHCQPSTRK